MKPLLFSAFIFPGLGYFFVNKPIRGIISMLLVAGVLAVFIKEALYKSNIISQQILNGEIIIGTSDIRKAIIETPGNIDPAILSLATYLFLAVWAWSIIDCYRLSKKTSTPSE